MSLEPERVRQLSAVVGGSMTLFELLTAEGVDQSFIVAEPAPDPSSPA